MESKESCLVCGYCKNIFKSELSLKNHQKNTKYCLKIQGKSIDNFKCEYCTYATTSKGSLKSHNKHCKTKRVIDIIEKAQSEIKEDAKEEADQLTKELLIIKDKLRNETEMKEYIMKNSAKSIKITNNANTNNTNNTNNNLTLNAKIEFMQEKLKPFHKVLGKIPPIIDDKFTEDHLLSGISGCATFIHDQILTSSTGDPYYVTIGKDNTFYYKNNENHIEIDDGGKMVRNHIIPKIVDKSKRVIGNKKQDSSEGIVPLSYAKAYRKIKGLENDHGPLMDKLAKKCKISSDKIKLEQKNIETKKEIRPYTNELMDVMAEQLKTFNEDTLESMFTNINEYCKFVMEYLDYKYDVYDNVFYYFRMDSEGDFIKETETIPGLLSFIFDIRHKHLLKSPRLYKLRFDNKLYDMEKDSKTVDLIRDTVLKYNSSHHQ